MYTIDASVWMNARSPAEAGSGASKQFLDAVAAARSRIVVPTLLVAEISGAISRTRGDPVLARDIADALLSLPNLLWIDLDLSLARRAAALAAEHALRGADSVYAAVAITHGCSLVSLDREHLSRLVLVVRTMTPAEALSHF